MNVILKDPNSTFQDVFAEIAKLLSTVLVVPKNSILRSEALRVLGQVIKILVTSKDTDLVYFFRDEIVKSLDDVIKDLATEATTKDMARDLKTVLMAQGQRGQSDD